MTRVVHIVVNGKIHVHNPLHRRVFVVREVDRIQVRIAPDRDDLAPTVYFEDYQAPCRSGLVDGVAVYETPEHYFFAECFGYATVRIEFVDLTETVAFDVLAKKTTVEQARKMISYLSQYGESLLKSCFARTTYTVGTTRANVVDPESMLSSAEKLVQVLQSSQSELLHHLRERLVPQRIPLSDASMAGFEIDPSDVVTNLDALMPSAAIGDVFIRGRYYDLSSIHVAQLKPTADVVENQIILGGLYSIRRQIGQLHAQLAEIAVGMVDAPADYEQLSRLLLSLTAGVMIRRCQALIDGTEHLIKLFERQLGVNFNGEIAPLMTGYARSTRLYRVVFVELSAWYELGTPTIDGVNFLMKMKSLSSIYEKFVLFHLLEHLLKQGWTAEGEVEFADRETMVPSRILLVAGDNQVTLQYEPIIRGFNQTSRHMDLVDTEHKPSDTYPYWKPDFVLRLKTPTAVQYLILDAKYSTREKVKKFHLGELHRKYYLGMSVYDSVNGIISPIQIAGVFAIYALDQRITSYLPMWRGQTLNAVPLRLPMIGGVGLMTDNDSLFGKFVDRAFEILQRTVM